VDSYGLLDVLRIWCSFESVFHVCRTGDSKTVTAQSPKQLHQQTGRGLPSISMTSLLLASSDYSSSPCPSATVWGAANS
jgi:hypothetical protein